MSNLVVRVFISHSWSYSEHYDTLFDWIFEEKWVSDSRPITFLDHSVPRNNPIHNARRDQDLERAIKDRICLCDVVAIPTGMYATYSKWIKKEIKASTELDVSILAIDPWGQKRSSSVVQHASKELVGWDKNTVVSGLWALANGKS